jgi:glycosyltransferase involved in cell wall biosynthesis
VLGFVTEEQLEQLYRAALLVVIPLRYGGGVKGKTVEAMAHGVPIVCTDCSLEGMPGWRDVVDPRQHAAPLSEGIAGLYGDRSALAEISRKQRAYVARHFNREMMREAFVRVFSPRAIQSRGNAPG